MSLLLQSKDIFENILLLDPSSGEFKALRRSDSSEFLEMPINGTFAYLERSCLMFYRLGTVLRFQVEGNMIEINNSVASKLENKNQKKIFRLMRGEEELLNFEYRVENLEKAIPGDTTAFVDEEDFDFCQFVHNVLNNPHKRDFIYQNS